MNQGEENKKKLMQGKRIKKAARTFLLDYSLRSMWSMICQNQVMIKFREESRGEADVVW